MIRSKKQKRNAYKVSCNRNRRTVESMLILDRSVLKNILSYLDRIKHTSLNAYSKVCSNKKCNANEKHEFSLVHK